MVNLTKASFYDAIRIRIRQEMHQFYESGAAIKVLVDPKNPDRSYFPLPLSMWGLLYAVPIAALVIPAVIGGFYSGREQRRIEAKHRIPESEWKTVRYSRHIQYSVPR